MVGSARPGEGKLSSQIKDFFVVGQRVNSN
jgi:hypothetical protein